MKHGITLIIGLLLMTAPLAAHGPVHETIQALENELLSSPDDPAILLRLSELHLIHGDTEEAARCIEQVDESTHPEALRIQARILAEPQPAAAIHVLEAYARATPDRPDGWFELARMLASEQRYKEAAAAQEEGLTKGEATSQQRLTAALLHEQAGQPEKALALLEPSLEQVDETHLGTMENRARLLYVSGQTEAALTAWQQLREAQPKLAFRWWKIEGDMTKEHDADHAQQAYQAALAQLEARYEFRDPPAAMRKLMEELSAR